VTSHPDPHAWQRPASASLVDPEDDLPSSNYAGDFETTAIPRYDSAKSSSGEPFGLIGDPEPLPYVQPGGRHSLGPYGAEPTEIEPDAGDDRARDRRGTQDLGLLLLRLAVGALLIGHGLQNAFGLFGGYPSRPMGAAFIRNHNLDELIARRAEFLTRYQDNGYSGRYRKLVERVRSVEAHKTGAEGKFPLTEAVARYYFKLMAYKDEYEVARLYSDPGFARKIEGMFEGGYRLKFHLAPPIFNKPDPRTGEARKSEFGPWMMAAFRILAKLKRLRGTPFDVFGMSEERKTERRLIGEYEATVAELLEHLDGENRKLAVEIASVPEHIRGFGHVKRRHLGEAKKKEAELITAFRASRPSARAA